MKIQQLFETFRKHINEAEDVERLGRLAARGGAADKGELERAYRRKGLDQGMKFVILDNAGRTKSMPLDFNGLIGTLEAFARHKGSLHFEEPTYYKNEYGILWHPLKFNVDEETNSIKVMGERYPGDIYPTLFSFLNSYFTQSL